MQESKTIDPTLGLSESFVDIPNLSAADVDVANYQAMLKRAKQRLHEDMGRIRIWKKDTSRVDEFNKFHESVSGLVPCEFFCTYPKSKVTDLANADTENGLGLSANQQNEFMLYSVVKNLISGEVYSVANHLSDYGPNPDHEVWSKKVQDNPALKETVPEPPVGIYGCEHLFHQHRFQIDPLMADMSPQAYYTFLLPESTLLTKYKVQKK
jgi:hypothetical protein